MYACWPPHLYGSLIIDSFADIGSMRDALSMRRPDSVASVASGTTGNCTLKDHSRTIKISLITLDRALLWEGKME